MATVAFSDLEECPSRGLSEHFEAEHVLVEMLHQRQIVHPQRHFSQAFDYGAWTHIVDVSFSRVPFFHPPPAASLTSADTPLSDRPRAPINSTDRDARPPAQKVRLQRFRLARLTAS